MYEKAKEAECIFLFTGHKIPSMDHTKDLYTQSNASYNVSRFQILTQPAPDYSLQYTSAAYQTPFIPVSSTTDYPQIYPFFPILSDYPAVSFYSVPACTDLTVAPLRVGNPVQEFLQPLYRYCLLKDFLAYSQYLA